MDDDNAAGPSPRALALLDDAARAMAELRSALSRLHLTVHALDSEDVATETGHRNTRRLLEEHLHLDARDARRVLRHADLTLPGPVGLGGHVSPALLPATGAALADGDIGDEHITVIARTLRRIDQLGHIDPGTRAVTEAQLARLARDRTACALADAATEILSLLDPDGAAPTDRDLPDNELHLTHRADGTLLGKFRYTDPAAAQLIAAAIAAATPAPDADGDPADTPGGEPLRTHPERQAQALLDLTTEALTRGTDIDAEVDPEDDLDEGRDDDDLEDEDTAEPYEPDLRDPDRPARPAPEPEPGRARPRRTRPATEGGERVHVAVAIDLELLRTQIGARNRQGALPGLARLGSGRTIGPETARRLACDAHVIPLVLGSRGEPLDIGRRSRVVPPAMRAALVHRDRHCAHPGCRRRPRKCSAHHLVHWAHGGLTTLDNLVLLCVFHHALIHHGGWTIAMIDGLPWFRPPRWIDPQRRPRHNRPWHDADPSSGHPA